MLQDLFFKLYRFALPALLLLAMAIASAQQNETPEQEEAEEKAPESYEYASPAYRIERSKIKISEPVSREKQQSDDLSHYLKPANVMPLLAGPEDFTTLIKDELTSNSRGVAILLPDWQQGATAANSLNYLRKVLPDQGWTTIAIQPYEKPANYPSIALKPEEQQEANKTSLEQYRQKLSAMMTAVMEKAKSYPGIFLVIAQGSHAALLTDLYQEEKVPLPNALVVLSSYMLTATENETYAKTLAQTELPVLDLSLKRDHPLAIGNAELRQAYANKEMKASYRQRILHNFTAGYYPEESLLREINSWLRYEGW
ncbi:DUF3530 family protein [Thalassomonas haliotis]|uniref:DUF3530 family protein n=1 Tax=Thalassomonas haliotis TaxID=485448 RepID=A0ABY7VF93_9GAMM|nr:DUF3530 family protein [Thalassomonas haliotis]WDE12378.1 DUF3530 family protein [Thalassomonas haliotis]